MSDQNPPTRRPPRRRPGTATLGSDPRRRSKLAQKLGVPLSQALRCPASDLEQSRDEAAAVAQAMTLPPPEDATMTVLAGRLFTGQHPLSYLVARALEKETAVAERCKVTPQVLQEGRKKLDVLSRARRTAAKGHDLTADGRLLLRAKFSFFYKIVITHYEGRIVDPTVPLSERLALAQDFARVDAVRFRMAAQKAEALKNTTQEKQALAGQVADTLDEKAFLEARRLLEAGQQPDLATLERAMRYAARLQSLPTPPAADRRTESR